MKFITVHSEAYAEVVEAAEFYESCSPGLGFALLAEVERSLEHIAATPEAWQHIGKRARCKPLWRFPYSVICAVYPNRVRVVALAHQKRRPFYWRRRLKEPAEDPTSA